MQFGMKIKQHAPWAIFFVLAAPFVVIGFLGAFVIATTIAGARIYNDFITDVMPD